MSPRKPLTQEEKDEVAAQVRANPPECPGSWPFDSAEDEREAACLSGRPLWGPDE